MSCHPKCLVMLLKETVIYKIRLTDCKLAIKLTHLFHLSSFHFQQHHEDFDYAENNQINRIEICFSNESKSLKKKKLDARNKLVACLLARLLITRAQIPKQ